MRALLWSGLLWSGSAWAEPGWDDLAPWRTWVVLEHVGAPQHWFVAPTLPMSRQRCEVGIPVNGGAPTVWCGRAKLGATEALAVQGPMRKVAREARDALSKALGIEARDLAPSELVFVGTMSRVTFRQVVPVGDGPGIGTPARTAATSWDVTSDGEVHPAAVEPDLRVTAVCARGIHPDCDEGPTLLPYTPPPGWEGQLVPEGVPSEALAALEGAVAAAIRDGFQGADARSVSGDPLPDGFSDHLVLTMQVQAHGSETGAAGDGRFDVDVALAEAMQGPTRLRMPVDGVPAAVELDVDLPSQSLTVRVRPARGRYVEHTLALSCPVLATEQGIALPGMCQVDSAGRWLRWDGPEGQVMVQVAPDAGPRLAVGGASGIRMHDR